MRSDTVINAEIAALRQALAKSDRWNNETRHLIEQTIKVLDKRMTEAQIEREYYIDEASEEYQDGDNLLYGDLLLVCNWMNGEKDYDAPSEGL
jgi:parvulin-like peptidyl-prolyl isomerase